jgi:hypothetical protein
MNYQMNLFRKWVARIYSEQMRFLLLLLLIVPIAAWGCAKSVGRKGVDDASMDAGYVVVQEDADAIVEGGDESDWELVESNTTESLTAIWGFEDDDIWALSANSLLHYDGRSWDVALENEQWNLTGLWGAAPDDIWAVGTFPEWFIMHYDGSGWEPYDFGETQPVSGFSGVWGTSAQSVYAFQLSSQATWEAPWYWDGTTWMEHNAEIVYPNEEERWSTEIYSSRPEASSTSPDNIVVADFGGIVLYDGTQWSVIESGLASTCTADAAWVLDGGGFLIGKSFCGIRAYGNVAGIPELDVEDFSPPVIFGGFWGTSDRDIYAIGFQWQAGRIRRGIMYEAHAVASHIWHYDGQSWSQEDLGDLAVSLSAIWGSPSGQVWVVGDEGTILRRRP